MPFPQFRALVKAMGPMESIVDEATELTERVEKTRAMNAAYRAQKLLSEPHVG